MKSRNDTRSSQHPPSNADQASSAKTRQLFRIFALVILGAIFVHQMDINYLWLSAILTAAALTLAIMLLIRVTTTRSSRLILVAAIVAVVVSAVQVLLVLASVLFFSQLREFQECSRSALTEQAISRCQTTLEKSLPGGAG